MDASDRKNTWVNLEDDFWEVEARWRWLTNKAQIQPFGRFSFSSVSKEGTIPRDGLENARGEAFSTPGVVGEPVTAALGHFCHSVYSAIQKITRTMATVKGLMWRTWENETICESFYDAVQFSQQLLENLSTSWGLAFSLFRAQELELLYKSEKLVSQSTAAHQLALKFIMSSWQTYLAAHCHSWTAKLNHARTKVKESCHDVGHLFAKSLVASHALTVAVSECLQPFTANEALSTNTDYDGLSGSEGRYEVNQESLITFSARAEAHRKQHEENLLETNLKASSSLRIDISNPNDASSQEAKSESLESGCSPMELGNDEEFSSQSSPKSSLERGSEPPSPLGNKNETLLKNHACQHRKKQSSGRESSATTAKKRSTLFGGRHHLCFPTNKSNFERGASWRRRRKESSRRGSRVSRCKCCCGKRGTSEEGNSSSSSSDDDDICMQVNCLPGSSSSQPEFKIKEWQSLMEDVKDLKIEWENLSVDFSKDDLEEKLKSEMTLKNLLVPVGEEILKSEMTCKDLLVPASPVNVAKKEEVSNAGKDNIKDGDAGEVENDDGEESLSIILAELISAMQRALDITQEELQQQVRDWEERQALEELQQHLKGFDPNEALMQAKRLLFQLMQSFFSMMLLTAADNRRRVLCYASLLPESIAESRKFAYNLVLSRDIDGGRKPKGRSGAMPASDALPSINRRSKTSVVNPHPLCHHLAMALCKAHAFANKFIIFVTAAKEERQ